MYYSAHQPPLFQLTSGPVEIYPEVLRAMSRVLPYDYDSSYQTFYEAMSGKLKRAMRSSAYPLVLQADPVLGAEAAAASLIGPDDVVLNLVSGVYGKGFGEWARLHAREMIELEVAFDSAIDPEAVRKQLAARPDITIVSVLHHDTPSGTINPVHEIGAVVRDAGPLLIVDATSSFGGMDVHPQEVHADFFITGSSKCLGAPPALTMVHVSDRAWAKMEANPRAPRNSILSVLDWRDSWSSDKPFAFTTSGADIHALDAALDIYLDEGPEQVWKRHAATARTFRAGVKALGLSLWAASENIASPSCTAIRLPEGISDSDIIRTARELFGVSFAPGRGATKGRLIRVGHMGRSAYPTFAIVGIAALGGSLRHLGVKVDTAAGMQATLETAASP